MDPYWDWFNETLKMPKRATGGEPCRVCGNPIPSQAAWMHRDRHVCSIQCNGKLIRRMKRGVEKGLRPGFTPPPSFLDWAAEERGRDPRVFSTVEDAEFPYEHGKFPIEGDIVERHGQHTAFVDINELPWKGLPTAEFVRTDIDAGLPPLAAVHFETGLWGVHFRATSGEVRRFTLGHVYVSDTQAIRINFTGAPTLTLKDGSAIHAGFEMISDVDDAGNEYRWEAFVFCPAPPVQLWAPARTALSKSRRRTTSARSAYQARMRAQGVMDADADRFDPRAVYQRDGWVCQVCKKPIDRNAVWPDPWSVTLDHKVPVTKQGAHTIQNTQTAHWLCNVIKGNRGPD